MPSFLRWNPANFWCRKHLSPTGGFEQGGPQILPLVNDIGVKKESERKKGKEREKKEGKRKLQLEVSWGY